MNRHQTDCSMLSTMGAANIHIVIQIAMFKMLCVGHEHMNLKCGNDRQVAVFFIFSVVVKCLLPC